MRWLVFLALALLVVSASPTCAAPATVEPGVTIDIAGTPLSVLPGDSITRTITVVNSNLDKPRNYDIGFTYVVQPTPIHVAVTATGTMPGLRKARTIQMAVPADFLLVPGSLKINGATQADPTITGGYYSLTLDLRMGTTTIMDVIQFAPLP